MAEMLVPCPAMIQERMNICQNAMNAPRLTPPLYI